MRIELAEDLGSVKALDSFLKSIHSLGFRGQGPAEGGVKGFILVVGFDSPLTLRAITADYQWDHPMGQLIQLKPYLMNTVLALGMFDKLNLKSLRVGFTVVY